MLTILIVDDDANIRKLLEVALKKEGFSVVTARDGNEAFVQAIESPPDVAILDVMMPGLHGYELCRRLRANPITSRIKIIFLTARSQPYDQQAGLDAGADLFLGKPVMPNELANHIRALTAPTEPAEPSPLEPKVQKAPPVPKPAAPLHPSGHLVACFSLTPQVGVTTLAVNLALAFALSSQQVTPLIELHNEPGDILDMMGLEQADWREFAQEKTVQWDDLASRLVKHPMGVRVLPAPPVDHRPSPEWIEQAVVLLQNRFPRSVADVTSKPDAGLRSMLLLIDYILLVTTPEVQAIRNTLRALEGLRTLNVSESNILLVVNHVQAAAQVPIEKIQTGIKHKIFAVIPHTPNMTELVRAGRPLLLTEPGSPAARAIGRMAMQIAKL
ncbi:MAG: response regulator [Anaerolineae bacterium]|nr:response regulator [Anaerolineae bacterium]